MEVCREEASRRYYDVTKALCGVRLKRGWRGVVHHRVTTRVERSTVWRHRAVREREAIVVMLNLVALETCLPSNRSPLSLACTGLPPVTRAFFCSAHDIPMRWSVTGCLNSSIRCVGRGWTCLAEISHPKPASLFPLRAHTLARVKFVWQKDSNNKRFCALKVFVCWTAQFELVSTLMPARLPRASKLKELFWRFGAKKNNLLRLFSRFILIRIFDFCQFSYDTRKQVYIFLAFYQLLKDSFFNYPNVFRR